MAATRRDQRRAAAPRAFVLAADRINARITADRARRAPAAPADLPAEVLDAINVLIDVSTSSATNDDGETFVRCWVCDEWDGHADGCGVAALRAQFETEN